MFWSSASRPSCESGLLNSIFYGSDPNRKSFHRILRALVLVVIVGWGMPVNWMRETGEEAFCPPRSSVQGYTLDTAFPGYRHDCPLPGWDAGELYGCLREGQEPLVMGQSRPSRPYRSLSLPEPVRLDVVPLRLQDLAVEGVPLGQGGEDP